MDVLILTKSRNKCLKRFLEASIDFRKNLKKGDLDALTEFQKHREAILKALDLYERKASEAASCLPESDKTAALISNMKQLMTEQEHLTEEIARVDGEIIRQLNSESEELKKEIQQAKKSKSNVGKFKSNWAEKSGKGVDKVL